MSSGELGERRWSWGGGALHVVRWGDEAVAFHESTASTHVFDEDTFRLVETLRQSESAVTIASLWIAAFGEAPSRADCQTLSETLDSLSHTGLVTATSP